MCIFIAFVLTLAYKHKSNQWWIGNLQVRIVFF